MRVLGRLGPDGVLPGWAAAGVARLTGFRQVLTRRATIEAVLGHDDVRVPYRLRSEALGLGAFPLALDGTAHGDARAVVADVLAAAEARHRDGVVEAGRVADAALAAAGPRVDVVATVIDPALRAWVETWFGLPDQGPVLGAAGRAALHAIFLNPDQPARATDAAALVWAADEVGAARHDLAEALAGRGPGPAPGPDTVAGALRTTAPRIGADPAAFVVGMTVGPLALGPWALALAVDHLLAGDRLDASHDPGRARTLLDEALAARPPLPGVPRQCPRDLTVVPAGGGRPIDLPHGPFLAAGAAAPTPADRAALAFGLGPHVCMGRGAVTDVGVAVLGALARHRPRRAPGPAGRLRTAPAPAAVRRWPFPGHLEVDRG